MYKPVGTIVPDVANLFLHLSPLIFRCGGVAFTSGAGVRAGEPSWIQHVVSMFQFVVHSHH